MTDVWIVIGVVGIATVLFKAAGPVFLGRRTLPRQAQSVIELLAPVMLTALVVTQTVGGDGELSLDARVPGVAAAAATIAVWRRAPLVGVMAVAAAVTALVRVVA
jgi:branched-subunit amino acid transport protein